MGACVSNVQEEIIIRRKAPYGADPHSFAISRKVERDLEKAQQRNQNTIKLLLLGSGNSGKSTVMKQFKLFLKNGFSMEERRGFRDVIWRSCIESMRILAQLAQDLAENAEDAKPPPAPAPPPSSLDEFALKDAASPEGPLSPDVESVHSTNGKDQIRSYNLFLLQRVRDDQQLWEEMQVPVAIRDDAIASSSDDEDSASPRQDEDDVSSFKTRSTRKSSRHRKRKKKSAAPAIQWETMTVGRLLQKIWWNQTTRLLFLREEQFLETPLVYFMSNMDRIARADYHPTNEDILLARKRTNGVSVLEFEKGGKKFVLMDVGGQKTERKKWLAHFDNVHAVIFVVGLDQYDQILIEEGNGRPQNRLQESLDLFEGMCQSPWFRKSSFILFLNKSDLFKLKIKKVPITVWKSEYAGDPFDNDQCLRFIKKRFANVYNGFSEVRRQEDASASLQAGVRRQPFVAPELYVHVTCATDSSAMQFVIQACQDILLRSALGKYGILPLS